MFLGRQWPTPAIIIWTGRLMAAVLRLTLMLTPDCLHYRAAAIITMTRAPNRARAYPPATATNIASKPTPRAGLLRPGAMTARSVWQPVQKRRRLQASPYAPKIKAVIL